MKRFRSLILWTALAAAVNGAAPPPTGLAGIWKVLPGDLAPANAYLPDFDDSGWDTLEIPGNWHLQDRDYAGVVWHRRHFTAPVLDPGALAKLTFEGVDYAADVWLNGDYLGFHEGYFEPFSFYIQNHLKPGSDNVLVVRVNSPNETPEAWSLHKRLIKGVLSHHDTRPGGAWSARGQEQNTGGIWAPVTLTYAPGIAFDRVHVTTRPEADHIWAADVDVAFSGDQETPLTFEATLEPDSFTGGGSPQIESVEVARGAHTARFAISVRDPKLWWTWDRGDANLYRLTLRATAAGGASGESVTRFGFRTIEVDPGSRQWRLNGEPIFLRGTNYISSQWFSEMTPARFGFDLDLMKHAYVNAVRVHAHLEPAAFYEQCDQKGILVWQDFALQWGYDDSPAFQAEATRQAAGMVDWLYNHPSIGAWTLQNEPPFDADWMKYKYRDYRPGQNRDLNQALTRAVSEADRSRWVHDYSTTGEHQWLGWYAGSWKDFAKPSKEAIISEYGAQALPGLPALRKIFSEKDLWPTDDTAWGEWEYHNFQRHETFELAGVPQGANIQEWIDNTQRYQARLTQFAAENYRRQKNAPVTAIFQFLFNEDWPSVNWGVVDYWRNPKPGYEALRIAYQPVLPSIAWTQDRWETGESPEVEVWIVNDLIRDFPQAGLVWTLRNTAGVLREEKLDTDIAADSAGRLCHLNLNKLADGAYEILLRLKDRAGHPMGENRFAFSVGAAVRPEAKP